MSREPACTSQTLDNESSDIEVMADFREVPDYPFWKVPGFLFDEEIVEEITRHEKKIWKALICPDHTSIPKGSSINSKPEKITGLRVRNNVALLFRALLFFCDFHPSPTYWMHLSPATFPGSGDTIIKLLESLFVRGRRAYIALNGARTSSNVALYADKYIKFLDSAGNLRDASGLTRIELRDKWAVLKKKGALINLSQHRPSNLEDDGSDDEPLTLPGERSEKTSAKKRKNPPTAPVTPNRPKRPSTSSARRSSRTVRVVAPSSSPPLPRFDSAIGFSSGFSPISEGDSVDSPVFGPGTPSRKINERVQSMDLKISKQEATLVAHSNAIESLKVDVSLRKQGKTATGLTTTVKETVGRIEKLEEKKKKSEKYTTQVVRERLDVFKAGNDERLGVMDARIDSTLESCAAKHALEVTKRNGIGKGLDRLNAKYSKLREAVKRHRDDHKKLGREINHRLEQLEDEESDAESDQNSDTDPVEEEEPTEVGSSSVKSRLALMEEEVAALKLQGKKDNARIKFLETAPSLDLMKKQGDDLQTRVKAQEEEITRLKEGDRRLREEMVEMKSLLEKRLDEIPGLVQSQVRETMQSAGGNFERQQHSIQRFFPPRGSQKPRNPELSDLLGNNGHSSSYRSNNQNRNHQQGYNGGRGGGR
ncbi:hypothetical protein QBC40DRAFT_222834 [Triangularia verruculosa]|uniref:Uncharacterized protein n=1 Tax=Triangularia verruculosa TaxID=2587418 RepID=A0AAN7AY83_9PEZI|nr:hypothetical protein QBC40DRAFT_222834 [Triangularia verruculosa]